MTPTVRVLVVDDDPLVRAGVTMMLDGAEGIQVVGEADDGDRVEAVLDAHPADVVLMDLRMRRVDGVTATRRVRARPGAPEVVVLTTFDSDADVLRALNAGASGFLLKDTPPARVVAAVQQAASGEPVLSPSVARRLIGQAVDRQRSAQRAKAALADLSDRERQVVHAIGRGLTNADISTELDVTVPTVKAHVSHVLVKLGLDNRTQVALLAHDAGLV